MAQKTDLFIIGSGPGGYRTAEYAAKNGLQVVIVESAHAGGTCLNCGCIPTKAFCHDAELAEQGLHVEFSKVAERKQKIVEQLRSGVETLMKQPGITFIHGHAQFLDSKTVEVVSTVFPESSSEGWGEPETVVQQFEPDNIIIASGSRTKILPIPGIVNYPCITSTEMLDIQKVPERLCIIGAGVIGLEFASAFASFGSEVTVVEFLKECLPAMDSDIAKRLRKQLEKRGVTFCMQAGVKKVEDNIVTFERKGKLETVEADTILIATGRIPNIENMNLDKADIAYDKFGIKVCPDTFEVERVDNAKGPARIFAIGDVNGRQLLAHAATMQGRRVVNTLLGLKDEIRFDIIPAAVFTSPEAACVGPTEEQLKEAGREFTCHKGFYRSNGKALAIDATEGIVKLLVGPDDKIIGCHILGAHAADLVQEIAALMCRDTTLAQLRDIVHIHPTLSEILQDIQ
ncbi:MAG: dihydrolipoyl dehydrogenase [Prevotella sp.]|nr:dihydrolipoyl dehydrogenase [Prevotella sp.]